MWLLDTDVVSEIRKGRRGDAGVISWYATVPPVTSYLSVLVVGELRHGIELVRRRDASAAINLDRWLASILLDFGDRVLDVDRAVADMWGRLGVPDPVPEVDGLLAATALVHDLTLVTRNISDVRATGARCLNPFHDAA